MAPNCLHKYRCWNNVYHKRLLTHDEIFFACPDSLNDPFDSTIPIRFDKGTEDQAFNMALEIVQNDFPRYNVKAQHDLAKDIVNLGNWKDADKLRKFVKFRRQYLNDHFGICSLAGSKNINLVWSHYAEGHKGICVGFDSQKLLNYLKYTIGKTGSVIDLYKIEYVNDFPYLDGFKISNDENIIKALTIKSSDWSYEEEYRLILLTGTNKTIRLEDGIIVEVIIGCKMSQTDKDEIVNLLRKRSKKIILYEAKQRDDSYSLEFEEITY